MDHQKLFDRVIELCGFSRVLGPGILRRALADEGVDPQTATTDEYRRALPRLRARMTAYMSEDEAASRARRIAGLLAHVDGEVESEDEEDWSQYGRSVDLYEEVRRRLAESAEIPRGAIARDEPDDEAGGQSG